MEGEKCFPMLRPYLMGIIDDIFINYNNIINVNIHGRWSF